MENLLLERMRNILIAREIPWTEKKMMGGKTFMVDGKMCFGTLKGGLLCRIDPQERDTLLSKTGAEIITQNGREMKGYVYVQPEGYGTNQEIEFWISRCLAFNPKAKSSKKKK